MAFPNPLSAAPRAAAAALLAVAAAALWGVGTVLGRMVSVRIPSRDVTVLRFAIGLPASAIVLVSQGAPVAVTPAQLAPLALLALIPGLLGLALYYVGLRSTAAARATLAELAFPVTATLIGVNLLGTDLSPTQWLGLVVVVVSVTALGLRERAPGAARAGGHRAVTATGTAIARRSVRTVRPGTRRGCGVPAWSAVRPPAHDGRPG
jgi:drug/metabolite transporter (DMT)-like permease